MAIEDKTADVIAAAAAGAALGAAPMLGDYVVIVLCAVAGAFVSVSRRDDVAAQPVRSLIAMLRGVLISGVFAWLASAWLAARIDLPVVYLIGPVAFGIAFIGDDWFTVKSLALDWLGNRAGSNRRHRED